ncbi:MAG: hypothetical protein KBA14_06195 [Saprospiraceae bacterium]|nr:hypothetical protein [Saprospiraceae bacterium]
MKVLLFLTNIVLLSFLPSTCHHQQKQADDTVKVDSTSNPQPTVSDSMTTGVEETNATYNGNNLDSISRDDKHSNGTGHKHEAPKHDSPEQMKIDSIKAAKAKKKNG